MWRPRFRWSTLSRDVGGFWHRFRGHGTISRNMQGNDQTGKQMFGLQWNAVAVAYGLASMAASALHTVFITYYVAALVLPDVIGSTSESDGEYIINNSTGLIGNDKEGSSVPKAANVLRLTSLWFLWGETVFGVWNAINDPIFAWLLTRKRHLSSEDVRLRAVKFGGILWSFAFVLVFAVSPDMLAKRLGYGAETFSRSTNAQAHQNQHQWITGLHFVISLCCYDGALSLVMLAHGSVLADVALGTADRANCNAVSSLFGAIGACSVFFAHWFWGVAGSGDTETYHSFRLFCLVLACCAAVLFWWSGTAIGRASKRLQHDSHSIASRAQVSLKASRTDGLQLPGVSIRDFMHQLRYVPNFLIFAAFNFLQVFNCHFNSNFLPVMLTVLAGDSLPLWFHSAIVTLSALLPHVGVVYVNNIVAEHGLWQVINLMILMKVVLVVAFGLIIWLIWDGTSGGSLGYAVVIAFFLLLNKSNSEMVCRHGNLVLADVADEFAVSSFSANLEPAPQQRLWSPLVLGVNAFLTKPAASVAPAVGWLLLKTSSAENSSELGVVRFVFFVPLVVAVLQLLLWRRYTLRGEKLAEMRRWRKKMDAIVNHNDA